jgi:hypothetical protein
MHKISYRELSPLPPAPTHYLNYVVCGYSVVLSSALKIGITDHLQKIHASPSLPLSLSLSLFLLSLFPLGGGGAGCFGREASPHPLHWMIP